MVYSSLLWFGIQISVTALIEGGRAQTTTSPFADVCKV